MMILVYIRMKAKYQKLSLLKKDIIVKSPKVITVENEKHIGNFF